MANGVENLTGIAQTFWGLIEKGAKKVDPEVLKKIDKDQDGSLQAKEVILYVLDPKNQNLFGPQVKNLEASFKLIGIEGEAFQKILLENPKKAAESLISKGDGYKKNSLSLKGKEKRDEELRARQSYELGVKLDPTHASAYRNLAEMYYLEAKGEKDSDKKNASIRKARDHLGQSLKLETDPKRLAEAGILVETYDHRFEHQFPDLQNAKIFLQARAGQAEKLAAEAKALNHPEEEKTYLKRAEKYRERALFAYDPFFSTNAISDNPPVSKILDELQMQGISLATIKPEAMAEIDADPRYKVELEVGTVLSWMEANLDNPRYHDKIVSTLKKEGMWPLPWADKNGKTKKEFATPEFETLNLAGKTSAYHARQAEKSKNPKVKETHLIAATHFDDANAKYHRALGDFYSSQAQLARKKLEGPVTAGKDASGSKTNVTLKVNEAADLVKNTQAFMSKAERAYRNALGLQSSDTDSAVGLGRIYYSQGNFDQAYKYFVLPDVKAKVPEEYLTVAREKLAVDQKKYIALVQAKIQKDAELLLKTMTGLAKEILEKPTADSAQRWKDLKLVNSVYQDANQYFRFNQQKEPYQSELLAVNEEIDKFLTQLRDSVKADAANNLSYPQKLTNARLAVEIGLERNPELYGRINPQPVKGSDGKEYYGQDYEANIRQTLADLDRYTELLDKAPPGAISETDKAEAYLQIFKVYVRYRESKTIDGKEIISSGGLWERPKDGIHNKMWHAADKFLQHPPYNDPEKSGFYNKIFHDIIETHNTRFIKLLAQDALIKYEEKAAPAKALADEALQKAYAEPDPKKQRALLYPAIMQYAAIGDDSGLYRSIEVIENQIKYADPPMSAREQVSIYMALDKALQNYQYSGGGGNFRDSVRRKGNESAHLLWAVDNTSNKKERVENLLLAQGFYLSTGNPEMAKLVDVALSTERNNLKELLAFQGLVDGVAEAFMPGSTGSVLLDERGRLIAAGLIVKIDQALLPTEAKAAQESEDAAKKFAEEKVANLTRYREAILADKNLSWEDRLAAQKTLATVAMQYDVLPQKKDETLPLITGDVLSNELKLIEADLGKTLSEWSQGPQAQQLLEGVPEKYREPLKARLAADLKNQLANSMTWVEQGIPWVGNITPASLQEFAQYSMVGNILLLKADETKGLKGMQLRFEAAQVFSQAGMIDRVDEAMEAVMKYTASLGDEANKAGLKGLPLDRVHAQQIHNYKMVALTYTGADMKEKARDAYTAISEIGKHSVNPVLQEEGKLGEALILINQESFDSAKDILKDLKSEEAQLLLAKLIQGQYYDRGMKTVAILRSLIHNKDNIDKNKKEVMLAQLDEIQRLIASGETFASAQARVRQDARYMRGVDVTDIPGWFTDGGYGGTPGSYGGGSVFGHTLTQLVEASSTLSITDRQFSESVLYIATHAITDQKGHRDYTAASVATQMLLNDPYVGHEAKKLFDSLGDKASSDQRWRFVKSLPGVSLFADSNEISTEEALKTGITFVGPFIVGRALAVSAELAWAAYATEALAWSPTLIRVTGIGIKLVVEAGGVTLSSMALETLFTGKFDHWTPGHFGKHFSSFLITMVLLHGVGAGMGRVGKGMEGVSWLGVGAKEAQVLHKAGQLALRPAGQAAFVGLNYSSRIFGFMGTTYLNEVIGLHEKQNLGFFDRMLDAAIMDAQMIIGPDLFDAKFMGGRMAKKTELAKIKIEDYKLKHAKEKFDPLLKRLGLDPESPEGGMVMNVLFTRLAAGERVGKIEKAFGEKEAKEYQKIIKESFELDPKSNEGKKLMAFLVHYSLLRSSGKPPRPLSATQLAKETKQLNNSVEGFIKASGITEKNAAEEMRKGMVSLSLSRGFDSEYWSTFEKKGPEIRKNLEHWVEAVLGKGAAQTAEGRHFMNEWYMSTVFDAALTGKKPEEVVQHMETWVKGIQAEEKNVRSFLEGFLGEKAAESLHGKRLAAFLMVEALQKVDRLDQLPEVLRSFETQLKELKPAMESLLSLNRLKGEAGSVAMARWVLREGKTANDLTKLANDVIEGKVALTIEKGIIKELPIPEEQQGARQMAILEPLPGYPLSLNDQLTEFQIHPDNLPKIMAATAEQVLIQAGHDPKSPDFQKMKEALVKHWAKIEKGEIITDAGWLVDSKLTHEGLMEGRQFTLDGVAFKHAQGGKHLSDTARWSDAQLTDLAHTIGLGLTPDGMRAMRELIHGRDPKKPFNLAEAEAAIKALDLAYKAAVQRGDFEGVSADQRKLIRWTLLKRVISGEMNPAKAKNLAKSLAKGEIKLVLNEGKEDTPKGNRTIGYDVVKVEGGAKAAAARGKVGVGGQDRTQGSKEAEPVGPDHIREFMGAKGREGFGIEKLTPLEETKIGTDRATEVKGELTAPDPAQAKNLKDQLVAWLETQGYKKGDIVINEMDPDMVAMMPGRKAGERGYWITAANKLGTGKGRKVVTLRIYFPEKAQAPVEPPKSEFSYKTESLPAEVKGPVEKYFSEAAEYRANLEKGVKDPVKPQMPDLGKFPEYSKLPRKTQRELQRAMKETEAQMKRTEIGEWVKAEAKVDPKLQRALTDLLFQQSQKTGEISFLSPNEGHIQRVIENTKKLLNNPQIRAALEAKFGPNYEKVLVMAAMLSKVGFGHPDLNPTDNRSYIKNRLYAVEILDTQLKSMLMTELGLSKDQYALFREAILREGSYGLGTSESPREVETTIREAKKRGIDLEGVFKKGKYENPLTAVLEIGAEADVSRQRLQPWQNNETLMKALVKISSDPLIQELYIEKANLDLKRSSLSVDELPAFEKEHQGFSAHFNRKLREVFKREIFSKKTEFVDQLTAELELKGMDKTEARKEAEGIFEKVQKNMTAINSDSYLWFLGSYGIKEIKINDRGEIVLVSPEDVFPTLGAAANLPHVRDFHKGRLGDILWRVNKALGTELKLQEVSNRENQALYDGIKNEAKADTHTHLKMAVDFDLYIWNGTILSMDPKLAKEFEKFIEKSDKLLTGLFVKRQGPLGEAVSDRKEGVFGLNKVFQIARDTTVDLFKFVEQQRVARGEAPRDYNEVKNKDAIVQDAKVEVARMEKDLHERVVKEKNLPEPERIKSQEESEGLRNQIEIVKKKIELYERLKFFVKDIFNFQEGALTDFVPHFMAASNLLKISPADELPTLKRITKEVLTRYQADNVRYFEPRFNIREPKGTEEEVLTVIQAYEEWKAVELAKDPKAVIPEMKIILSVTKFDDPHKPYQERVDHKIQSVETVINILNEARRGAEGKDGAYEDFVLNPKSGQPIDPLNPAYAVKPSDVLKYLAGMDAARQEEYNPPSLFFEAFRLIENYNAGVRADGKPELAIGGTFHVSESNTDVSAESALRHTLDALYMKPWSMVDGTSQPLMSRLGHAIVPGIGDFSSLAGKKPTERVAERLRQIDHDITLLDAELPLSTVTKEGLIKERDALLKKYPTVELQENPKSVVELPEYSPARIKDLELRAAYTRDRLIQLGIVVETNPTSNLGISPYITGYQNHTLKTYLSYEYGGWAREIVQNLGSKKRTTEEEAIYLKAQEYLKKPETKQLEGKKVRVTINTDDLTLFGTNMTEEFYRMAVSLGIKPDALKKIIDEGFNSPIRPDKPSTPQGGGKVVSLDVQRQKKAGKAAQDQAPPVAIAAGVAPKHADRPKGTDPIPEDVAKPLAQGRLAIEGIAEINGQFIKGAVMLPHMGEGGFNINPNYNKSEVLSVDLANGVVVIKTNEPLAPQIKFFFDKNNPPAFLQEAAAGKKVYVDVIPGGGSGSAFPNRTQPLGSADKTGPVVALPEPVVVVDAPQGNKALMATGWVEKLDLNMEPGQSKILSSEALGIKSGPNFWELQIVCSQGPGGEKIYRLYDMGIPPSIQVKRPGEKKDFAPVPHEGMVLSEGSMLKMGVMEWAFGDPVANPGLRAQYLTDKGALEGQVDYYAGGAPKANLERFASVDPKMLPDPNEAGISKQEKTDREEILKWHQEGKAFKEKYDAFYKRLMEYNKLLDSNAEKMKNDPEFRQAREAEWRKLQTDWKELEGTWYYQNEFKYEAFLKKIDWRLQGVYSILLGESIQVTQKGRAEGETSVAGAFSMAKFPTPDQVGEQQIAALAAGDSKITRMGHIEVNSGDLVTAGSVLKKIHALKGVAVLDSPHASRNDKGAERWLEVGADRKTATARIKVSQDGYTHVLEVRFTLKEAVPVKKPAVAVAAAPKREVPEAERTSGKIKPADDVMHPISLDGAGKGWQAVLRDPDLPISPNNPNSGWTVIDVIADKNGEALQLRSPKGVPRILRGTADHPIPEAFKARKGNDYVAVIDLIQPVAGGSGEPAVTKSVPGILNADGRSTPGAALVPHQPKAMGYPFTNYRKLTVEGEVDLKNGIINLKREGSNDPIRFEFDAKKPPDFVFSLKPGTELDVLHGGGGSWRGGKVKPESLLERVSSAKLNAAERQEAQRQLVELAKTSPESFDSNLVDQLLLRGTQGEVWIAEVIQPLLKAEADLKIVPQVVANKLFQGVTHSDMRIQQHAFNFLLKMDGNAATQLLEQGFAAALSYRDEAQRQEKAGERHYRQESHEVGQRTEILRGMRTDFNVRLLKSFPPGKAKLQGNNYFITAAVSKNTGLIERFIIDGAKQDPNSFILTVGVGLQSKVIEEVAISDSRVNPKPFETLVGQGIGPKTTPIPPRTSQPDPTQSAARQNFVDQGDHWSFALPQGVAEVVVGKNDPMGQRRLRNNVPNDPNHEVWIKGRNEKGDEVWIKVGKEELLYPNQEFALVTYDGQGNKKVENYRLAADGNSPEKLGERVIAPQPAAPAPTPPKGTLIAALTENQPVVFGRGKEGPGRLHLPSREISRDHVKVEFGEKDGKEGIYVTSLVSPGKGMTPHSYGVHVEGEKGWSGEPLKAGERIFVPAGKQVGLGIIHPNKTGKAATKEAVVFASDAKGKIYTESEFVDAAAPPKVPVDIAREKGPDIHPEDLPTLVEPLPVTQVYAGAARAGVPDPVLRTQNKAAGDGPPPPPAVLAPPIPGLKREGEPAGLLFGGRSVIGQGILIPRNGDWVDGPGELKLRYYQGNYEYQRPGEKPKPIAVGQKLTVTKPGLKGGVIEEHFIFTEFQGARPIFRPEDFAWRTEDLQFQVQHQLKEAGAPYHLWELKQRGKSVNDTDRENFSQFFIPKFEEASRSYDSGDPMRTKGGIAGGDTVVFAKVDAYSGEINDFLVRQDVQPTGKGGERWVVEWNLKDDRFEWKEQKSGRREPVHGIDQDHAVVPIVMDRMTGRLKVDPVAMANLGLSPAALQRMSNLDGLVVTMGGSALNPTVRYLDQINPPRQ